MVNADIYNLYSILEKRDRMPEEQISRTDFDAQVQRWIAEEYKRLWAEPQAEFDESTIHKIAQAEATERVRAEMERNPAFKEALLFRCAEQWSEERSNEYLQEHRPNGSYRADGILALDNRSLIKMCDATRSYVVQWARHETDPVNLRYIVSRLAVWDDVKYKSLADLEKHVFSDGKQERGA
jgi:hypothetical protein